MPNRSGIIDYKLAYSCFYLWISAFAFFLLAVEVTDAFMFLIILAGPVGTYWVICTYSIPPPDENVVNEILGTEVVGELFNENNTLKCPDEPSDFIMKVIAHRFAGMEAPENSMEALDLCIENGAVAVEFDLILTADHVPVLFHDNNMERVTDIVGDIKETLWDDLKLIDISVKHPFHKKYSGTHVPLFEDVVKKCLDHDLRFFIDVKDDRPECTNAILRMYEKYPKMYKRSIVSSFSALFIYNIRRLNPAIVVSMAWRPCYISMRTYSIIEAHRVPYSTFLPMFFVSRIMDHVTSWIFNNLAWDLIGFSAVVIFKDVVTPETVLYWKSRNVRLYAFTVNNSLEKLHLSRNLGVGYFTDSMIGD